jgi:uncharacterized protein
MRTALVVRGGWDGHFPVECTERFIPLLKEHGFDVEVHEDLDVYADAPRMAAADLVVQCWSQVPGQRAEISGPQLKGLVAAVEAGTGLAGWHGGMVASFDALPYLHLTGGRFVFHPPGFVDHELTVAPGQQQHPVMAGITTVRLHTEKYWVLTDPLCEVLATVTFDAEPPWHQELTVPAVWTRRWGAGKVFISAVGHHPPDLDVPEIRTLTGRGLLWAAR